MREVIRIQNRPDGRVDVLNLMEGGDDAIVLVRGLEPNKSLDLVINTQTSVSVDDVVELEVLKKMQGGCKGEKFPVSVMFHPQSINKGIYSTSFSITLDYNTGDCPEVLLILNDEHCLIEIVEALCDACSNNITTPIYLDTAQNFRMELAGVGRWRLTYKDTYGNLHYYIFSNKLIVNEWARLKGVH